MSTAWNAITIADLDAMRNTNMKQDPCYARMSAEWRLFVCHDVLNAKAHLLDNGQPLLDSQGTGILASYQR